MNAASETIATQVVRNGVDVTALAETVSAVQEDASIAAFKFRARNRWLGGDHNRTTIDTFYGACEEHRHVKTFEVDNGEAEVLLGKDQGANPLEHLLNALAACMTTSMAYHGAARGIDIESIESELDGDVDLRGFLGLSDQVRRGYSEIRVRFKVGSAASAEALADCARMSPVYEVVSGSVPVRLVVDKA